MASELRRENSASDLFALYRLTLQAERSFRIPFDDAAQAQGLSLADVLLLLHCRHAAKRVCQREFASELAISPAQVSARLEALRSDGLLESVRPSNDRRRQVWTVTPRGSDVAQQIERSIQAAGKKRAQAAKTTDTTSAANLKWQQRLAEALATLHRLNREAA
jgi:DNA-binding MarR family transcriptional regulator